MAGIFDRIVQLIKRGKRQDTRGFSFEGDFDLTLTEIARRQNRERQEVLETILRAGVNEILRDEKCTAAWESLSPREQEVTALMCMGYSSYQIADILTISYDTVRTHSKHIYVKFNMKRKELREALKDWRFAEWWESHKG